jgi:hypothetical protein
MPATRAKPAPVPVPGRLRRFVLLELPGWLILAVGVAYAISAEGGAVVVFFQAVLVSAALAWLAGGRAGAMQLSSLLFGWAAGTMAMFNLLSFGSIGIFLLPVTAYVLVVLVLLQSSRRPRAAVAAVAGIAIAALLQLLFLGLGRAT